ncbi:uncharacterized protein LOC128248076 [Octopus bimaculoides]|uniref:uncharacterized protein LOC128248076 n=1 Tax=Octopus bimaculoides TaxID=37653 RepID=UPI0022E0841D|nr:uncharacterized protein LOC128248076 [Octopus bimaculoides]
MHFTSNLSETLREMLFEEYRKNMGNVLDVIINEIRNGSVIVDHTVKTSNMSLVTLNSTLELIEKNGLVVGNITYAVTVVSLEIIYAETTQVMTTVPVTKEDSSDLILGLSIGISATVIFLLVLLLCFWFRWKKRNAKGSTKTLDRVQVDKIRAKSVQRLQGESLDMKGDTVQYDEIELNANVNTYMTMKTFSNEDKRYDEIDPDWATKNKATNKSSDGYEEVKVYRNSEIASREKATLKEDKHYEEIDSNWESTYMNITKVIEKSEAIPRDFKRR